MEKIIRKCLPKGKTGERIGGGILAVLVIFISVLVPSLILFLCYHFSKILGFAVQSFMCYQLLATKSLKDESDKVYVALKEDGLEAGRKAVSMIVGRDTENLTREGVVKAAVETVAENTSDGVIAPLFYMAIGGALFGFFYKAINTMDSMVGYKNENYRYFGTCAARLDDVVNYIPARLAALLMILASGLTGFHMGGAWHVFRRDRYKHKSPNSAQTEAVMAGALDIALAGDAYYFGKLHKKDTIGDAIRPVELVDIRRSHRLLYATSLLAVIFFLGFKMCVIFLMGVV